MRIRTIQWHHRSKQCTVPCIPAKCIPTHPWAASGSPPMAATRQNNSIRTHSPNLRISIPPPSPSSPYTFSPESPLPSPSSPSNLSISDLNPSDFPSPCSPYISNPRRSLFCVLRWKRRSSLPVVPVVLRFVGSEKKKGKQRKRRAGGDLRVVFRE